MRRPLAAFALAALLPVTAVGEDDEQSRTFYEVEVVIFEHGGEDRDKTEERWDPAVIDPRFDDVARFEGGKGKDIEGRGVIARPKAASDDGPLTDFRASKASDGSLGEAVKKLADANDYEVLRHLRWRQPPTSPRNATPLRVTAGDPLSLSVPERGYRQPRALPVVEEALAPVADAEESDEAAAAAATLSDEADAPADRARPEGEKEDEVDSTGAPRTPFGSGMFAPKRRDVTIDALDGTVTLVVSRYLHVHADLHYTKPVDWRAEVGGTRSAPRRIDDAEGDDGDGDGAEPVERRRVAMARDEEGRAVLSYPFEQRRRMRSGELHYLDHPVLGMLVLVQPREMSPSELDGATQGPSD